MSDLPTSSLTTPTIEQIYKHGSVRNYTDEPVLEGDGGGHRGGGAAQRHLFQPAGVHA